ncbi:toxin-antitoxin system YwqK family antitoxin [Actinospongicola halichondriae]|uniref:toxin-antitoxin system YwqK family antitoxin n=1 Tax=Actinospongicola halichondriae TaxID=3236844 RepID=UPI003D37762C
MVDRVAPDHYETSKGGLKFGLGERLPVGLVRELVAARLAELADVRNGARRVYRRDGALEAEGKMKDGRLHGRWNWYRADGSLLRTGSFVKGDKTGTWTTYDRAGHVVSTTAE